MKFRFLYPIFYKNICSQSKVDEKLIKNKRFNLFILREPTYS